MRVFPGLHTARTGCPGLTEIGRATRLNSLEHSPGDEASRPGRVPGALSRMDDTLFAMRGSGDQVVPARIREDSELRFPRAEFEAKMWTPN